MLRIGQGYDVHRLVEGRDLILGGVRIEFEKGLLGHSDADVLVHALMDAILGAAGLGDIGKHFPDTDPRYKGISSLELLEAVMDKARKLGYELVNADITVVAQKPKLLPFIPDMVQNIELSGGFAPGAVNIKATTEEGLGFTGSGQGIAAYAVCLLSNE